MGDVWYNIKGTTRPSFSIGRRREWSGLGVEIFQGPHSPEAELGSTGDLYIQKKVEPIIYKKRSDGWFDITSPEIFTISSNSSVSPEQSDSIYLIKEASEITITLSEHAASKGRKVTFKDAHGTSNINPIHITASNGQTIDGHSGLTINTPHASITIVSDGVDWFII